MAKNQEIVQTDINGKDITIERIGLIRFNLLRRVVNQTEFTSQWYSQTTVAAIAKHWQVTPTDINNLATYFALPKKVRGGNGNHVNSTKLIEDLRPIIKEMVDEAVREALK